MALTRGRIIEAALTLADREGLGGLTMRAVADELGVAPMSLYHHVANKDDLLQEISDAAFADMPSSFTHLAWDEALLTMCWAIRKAVLQHPCLGQLYFDRPISGPNILGTTDRMLAVFLDAGFKSEEAVSGFTALCVYTIGAAVFEISRSAGTAPLSADRRRLDGIGRAEAGGLTTLAALAPLLVVRGTEAQFEFGLGHLIDGLRADLAASKPRRAPNKGTQ